MLPNLLLRDMARANPTTNPPRSTMTDPNLLRKDRQDEARRQQQADERIHELEKEVERLRTTLAAIATPMSGNSDIKMWMELAEYRAQLAENALDGGGDADE